MYGGQFEQPDIEAPIETLPAGIELLPTVLCASLCEQKGVLERLLAAGGDLRLVTQSTLLPPTSWSAIDKSVFLSLGGSGMVVRYLGKGIYYLRPSPPKNMNLIDRIIWKRYRGRGNIKACCDPSEPPDPSPIY